MKITYFISGSSIILLGWLAATFVYQVPTQRYQKPQLLPTAVATPEPGASDTPSPDTAGGIFSISISH